MIKGKAHKYGNDVNTDVIIPARYLNETDPLFLAKHCMEDIDSEFVKTVQTGDIIVGGENFGCGSSREHAPIAIKAAGVSLVIAKSFARIFYRNSINIGLPILECEKAAEDIENGDTVEVELSSGIIRNITKNAEYNATAFPPFITELINAGGLVEYVKEFGALKGEEYE